MPRREMHPGDEEFSPVDDEPFDDPVDDFPDGDAGADPPDDRPIVLRLPHRARDGAAPAFGDGADEPAEIYPLAESLPDLLARGRQQGFITADEILQVHPEPEAHLDEVDELYAELLDLNIEVLDEHDLPDPGVAAPVEPGQPATVDLAANLDGVGLDDPVRMYLREIGRVPLLTADHEVSLAKRMERGLFLDQVIAEMAGDGADPPGELISLELYQRLRRLWPLAEEVYCAQYACVLPTTRHELLTALIPVTQIDPGIVRRIAEREHCGAGQIEDRLRHTLLLFELLPLPLRLRVDNWDWPTADELDRIQDGLVHHLKHCWQDVRADALEARHHLTEANLRLVVSVAKKYVGRGMNMLDLVQEGNIGLLKAVEKFRYSKGFKFSTYATWWIRQAITRAIADQARTIRIPAHMVETINRVVRAQRRLSQELGREPGSDELARDVGLAADKVREILKIAQEPVSLETPIGEEDDSHLGDFIEDVKAVAPADAASRRLLREQVELVLSQLTERERRVLELRFGLGDGRSRTLEEVGREFGVTRERIRQIEVKALKRLRHPSRSKKLRDYLE